jgi:glyoxylase-like metal-dependent hydrolase (beta-lactamase superfamily II)
MEEIVPGIFVETAYPPYNLALIAIDDCAIAVDMPPCPSHAQEWRLHAQEVAGPIRYVVLTNASPERQVGAATCKIPIIATEDTLHAIAMQDDRAWRELLHTVAKNYPEEADAIMSLSSHRVTISFNKHFMMHHRTPPLKFETVVGAEPGSMWLTVPGHHLLFAGDTVALDEPPPLERIADSKAWLNALGHLVKRSKIYQIVPGRGKAPILRGEVEQQREFIRIMRRTARLLARKKHMEINYTQPARDLGQTFFNRSGQKAVARIKQGLERFVNEVLVMEQSLETVDVEQDVAS